MKYFAEATFASFQICFQNHASEVWARGVPEICDDPSALFDPSVSLNDQSQEFQSRKQTGPEAAFLIDEMFLSRRNALVRSVAWVSHFDNKKISDAQDHRLYSSPTSGTRQDQGKIHNGSVTNGVINQSSRNARDFYVTREQNLSFDSGRPA